MMTTPLSNTYNRLHHLCRLLADSADARVASLDCCSIRTETRKISSRKTSAARSRSSHDAKWTSLPLRSSIRTTEPATKSP